MKLTPGVVMPLKYTAYYAITLVKIDVGNTGITSCTLKIGDDAITFKASEERGLLTVNGEPNNTPTIVILPQADHTVQLVPHQKPLTNDEVLLHHMLTYEVPKVHY